jgi:hypothetical protein
MLGCRVQGCRSRGVGVRVVGVSGYRGLGLRV